MIKVLKCLGALLLSLAANSYGQQTDRTEQIKEILDGLKWTSGLVVLGNGIDSYR
jgi:hypothetical protein